jgi:tetratricopeptide (TPR) repeat protein
MSVILNENRGRSLLIWSIPVIILFLIFTSACSRPSEVTYSIKKESIITYPFSDPDPIPVFARSSIWGAGAKIYPYFVFNGFSHESRPQEWTVVRLKNKYLEVSILPEVGGKVWGAKDLKTGREFIYTNKVLKFREIALRGPWVSGGIEFNFGVIGHSPATATPVDYHLEKKPDGSVACTVGNYDWPSRSRWEVTIIVHPDRAYFETKTRWTNPGPFHQSYYAWMNAAIPVAEDLHYVVPGRYYIGHDYSVPLDTWPVDRESRDLAWYKNNAFDGSKSYFVVGQYDNFFGAYYLNSDAGYGHWSLYSDMPGKKIWIWDLSQAGEIWVNLLTDNDGQYSEPQTGRLFNQSDHGTFTPASSDRWPEIWFPYYGIGEMTGVNPPVVVSLHPRGNGYELGIFALEKIKDNLLVKEDKKEILSEKIQLNPTEKKLFQLNNISEPEKLVVFLGKKIIHQHDQKTKVLSRPFNFHRPTGDSAESLYLAGELLQNEREPAGALEKYLEVIKKEPRHVRALSRLAELYLWRGEPEKAMEYGHKALEVSMYDPEANFIYGLTLRKLNKLTGAKEALGWAARQATHALPAYLQLAELAVAERDYILGDEYARRAASFGQDNPLPFELLATVSRLQGKKEIAKKFIDQLVELDPLSHLARYESYLLEPSDRLLENFVLSIKNEFPGETYLELALHYLSIGQEENALELLQLSPPNPEILTWLAFLTREVAREQSQDYLEKAGSASPYLVFPFRQESIPVFEWAASAKPDCWKFRYYLGLIFWHKNRIEEAKGLFKTLDEADYYPVFIARAYLNPDQKGKGYDDFKRANALSPETWRTWHHLINFELTNRLEKEALNHSMAGLEKFPENIYLQSDMVKALMVSNEFQSASKLLDRMNVLPYEGASEVHDLFARTHLHLALDNMLEGNWKTAIEEIARSREYPVQLGTGRPFAPDERMQDYLEAICLEHLGQKEEAHQKYIDIIEYSQKYPQGPYACFYTYALVKIGQKSPAELVKEKPRLPDAFKPQLEKLL